MKGNKVAEGITLIVIGLLFLFLNLGYISLGSIFDFLFGVVDLWPLIFIVIGINILARKNRLVSFITWSIFIIVLALYGLAYQDMNFDRNHKLQNIVIEKPEETLYGKFDLDLGAANLKIGSTRENLIIANTQGGSLEYKESYRDNKERAVLDFQNKHHMGMNFRNKGRVYDFYLNEDVVWDLDLDLGAVHGVLNLEEVAFKSIDLDFGAGDLSITFGEKYDHSNVKIDSGASDLTLIIPRDVGLKIKLDSALTKTNVEDLSLRKQGDYYLSPNYDEASTKLNFDIDMGVGRVDFKVK